MEFLKYTGAKITKRGIYDGMPLEVYHADPCEGWSVSSSGLRTLFGGSPAHYWDQSYYNPDAEPIEKSKAMVLGSASHALTLGDEVFAEHYAVRPDLWKDWRTSAAKEWKQEQEADGKSVLVPDDLVTIRLMVKALSKDPMVKAGILAGYIEKSMFWKDRATGVWLKARPDVIPNDCGDFSDLKTTSFYGDDIDVKAIGGHRYDMQAALVAMGWKELTGEDISSFSYIFITTKRPFLVESVVLAQADLEDAMKDLRIAIDTFAWCKEHNDWFGPAGSQMDARPVNIPPWIKIKAERTRNFLNAEINKPAVTADVP